MGNEYGDWYYFKKPYLFYSYLVDCTYKGSIFDDCVWPRLNPAISNLKISKEEKKMHKKRKYNRHNVHKGQTIFPMTGKRWSATFMYVVCPEKSVVIGWYEAPPNPETGENNGFLGRLTEWRLDICAPMLGKHGYLQEVLRILQKKCRERLSFQLCCPKVDNLKLFNVNKEEKKMGEIKKDRITLGASEGCYLELFNGSNTILFHFGTESREVTVPDDYEIDWGIKEPGTCDLCIKKKKPKRLNMKFTVKARPIFRKKYVNTTNDTCDSAISFPEPYAGEPFRLIIRDGFISFLSSDNELWECLDYTVAYTVNDIPLIERKIREAYNTRKIFPNATNGIEIIVDTTLKDIDTSKLHYVKVPENHIIIDFDIKGEEGTDRVDCTE